MLGIRCRPCPVLRTAWRSVRFEDRAHLRAKVKVRTALTLTASCGWVPSKLPQKTYPKSPNRLDRGRGAWHDYLIAPHEGGHHSKGMIIMAQSLTTAEVAEALDTTPRTLRKFLRSDANKIAPVGKGHRYAIAAGQVRTLRSQFSKWSEAQVKDNAPEADEADNTPETD